MVSMQAWEVEGTLVAGSPGPAFPEVFQVPHPLVAWPL